jgi:acyl-homoserine lactone acylase PvdQ
VIIVRDKQYGVPHIYGATDDDVEFGAGYAGAEDRLFLMDVLRHTARAQLSSFVGGAPGNRAMDRTQWAIAPYNEEDLQKQIDLAPTVYGDRGRELVERGNAFVDGINAYVDAANAPLSSKLPGEYVALGKLPTKWTLRDVMAEASLIGGIFGKGGGNEVRSALLLQALQQRFGTKEGRRAWADFRSKNDPEAPTTVLKKRFPYETASAFSKRGLALPDKGSVQFTLVAPPVATASDTRSVGAGIRRALTAHPHASNWELISARESATGHPIGVLGPQVGYYEPQILMEEDLHGPHFDARGASFPAARARAQSCSTSGSTAMPCMRHACPSVTACAMVARISGLRSGAKPAATISDAQTLLPSPRYATRMPSSRPKRSRIVITSASAWHGCVSSVSPLTTGIRACSASSSTSDCANVRTISASR